MGPPDDFTEEASSTSSEGSQLSANSRDLPPGQAIPERAEEKASGSTGLQPVFPRAAAAAAVVAINAQINDDADDAAPTGVENGEEAKPTSAKKKKSRKSKVATPERGKAEEEAEKPNSSKKRGRKSGAAKRENDAAPTKADGGTPKGAKKRKAAEQSTSTPIFDQPAYKAVRDTPARPTPKSSSKGARKAAIVVQTPKASNGAAKKLPRGKVQEVELDRSILQEIITRSGEGYRFWDGQWNREWRRGIALYNVDFVVASMAPVGDNEPTIYLLKFQNYPIPCWQNASVLVDAVAVHAQFKRQERYSSQIKKCLVVEEGAEKAAELYPHQYLPFEAGQGKGGYVTDPRALYFNKLKAIEHKINGILEAAGLPKIFIMDWTNLAPDLEGLLSFEFITKVEPRASVKKLLEEYKLAERIVCEEGGCSHCHYTHYSTKHINCCGMQLMITYDDADVAEFRTPKDAQETRDRKEEGNVQFECTDACHPDEEKRAKCKNRWAQRGRQQEVVLFRDARKGWVLRSTEYIEKTGYLGDYTGIVKRKASKAGTDDSRYDFMMKHRLKSRDGRDLPLLNVCAFKKGNETRFISHSCSPNLQVVMSAVERNGRWFTHPTFRASKNIPAGSELTFDYFVTVRDADVSSMFPFCLCKTRNCRYTEEKVAERKARMERERREALERGEEVVEEEEEEDDDESEDEEQGGEGAPAAGEDEEQAEEGEQAVRGDGEEREKAAEGGQEGENGGKEEKAAEGEEEDKGEKESGKGATEAVGEPANKRRRLDDEDDEGGEGEGTTSSSSGASEETSKEE